VTLLSAKAASATSPRVLRKNAAARSRPEEVLIPDKLYFRIGEVAKLCRLPAYVLRFWETEFSQLKPSKSSTGQRMYRRNDVEAALQIKRLLYHEGLTIPGARQHLLAERKAARNQTALPFAGPRDQEGLRRVRNGLREILALLSKPKR
jgi:DNA-binding transcriptional MerR regulator